MSVTPGGNPVCPTCGRDFCICMTPEQAAIAQALVREHIGNEAIAKNFAAVALNALAEAGYDVVLAND